ncbi:monovalent cation/H(+) antiporter subunit G [Candidatus Laterigemmans baculatus]|uniref:monovalent cation/H(+) antiporter subunit G n=1 Tax=Candidatus Laterigemmans baculatus TaxID=2770505 RepID=UPI0013DD4315|nr:monovalent cation/H(+) antiporter subunit G [Candidatus Laterigemmans baculatus]
MTLLDGLSLLSIASGCFFFVAGSVGMLRLPDAFTRLHALTKADSAGLGLLVLGLGLQADSWWTVLRLLLIWLLVLLSSATTCHLIAQSALRRGAALRRGDNDE